MLPRAGLHLEALSSQWLDSDQGGCQFSSIYEGIKAHPGGCPARSTPKHSPLSPDVDSATLS